MVIEAKAAQVRCYARLGLEGRVQQPLYFAKTGNLS